MDIKSNNDKHSTVQYIIPIITKNLLEKVAVHTYKVLVYEYGYFPLHSILHALSSLFASFFMDISE